MHVPTKLGSSFFSLVQPIITPPTGMNSERPSIKLPDMSVAQGTIQKFMTTNKNASNFDNFFSKSTEKPTSHQTIIEPGNNETLNMHGCIDEL